MPGHTDTLVRHQLREMLSSIGTSGSESLTITWAPRVLWGLRPAWDHVTLRPSSMAYLEKWGSDPKHKPLQDMAPAAVESQVRGHAGIAAPMLKAGYKREGRQWPLGAGAFCGLQRPQPLLLRFPWGLSDSNCAWDQ